MSKYSDPRKAILVVEDDPASAEMLALMLEDEGYEARVAETAQSAINLLGSITRPDGQPTGSADAWRPDLVLLDLQLPDKDGTEIIAHFDAHSQQLPPVIVLSAKMVATVQEAAMMIGAADVVHKPFDIDTLLGSIATVLAE